MYLFVYIYNIILNVTLFFTIRIKGDQILNKFNHVNISVLTRPLHLTRHPEVSDFLKISFPWNPVAWSSISFASAMRLWWMSAAFKN